MSKQEQKPKLTGPWRALHGAVWLIGLAILAWRDWWWPGILVLIAISMVIEAILRQAAPQAYEKEEQPATPSTSTTQQPAASPQTTAVIEPPAQSPAVPIHRLELLPSECPKCGGPIRGHEVRWTGAQSADCPFCGANLPMKRMDVPSGS